MTDTPTISHTSDASRSDIDIEISKVASSTPPGLGDHRPSCAQSSEGGRQAYLATLGGCLALAGTFGYVSSFGVFQDYYTRNRTASSSDISWIGSIQLFLFIALGLPAGKWVDKGYFKHVLAAGSLIYLTSLFMLSLAHVDQFYQLFLSQGVGMGIGGGLVYLPSMAVQGHHWKTNRAMAMGIVMSGTSLGGIFYPIMLNNLLHNSSVGFAWGVRYSAFVTLGLLIAANLIMTDRLTPKPMLPTSKPLQAQASESSSEKEGRELNHELDKAPRSYFHEVMIDYPFILMIAGTFLVILGLFFAYFYLQLFAALHNISSTLTFHQLTIQNTASIPGRILPGFLGDKFGTLNIFIIASVATGLLVFSMFGVGNVGGVIAFSILYGFFSGAVLSLCSPVIVSFAKGIHDLGIRLGIGFFVISFAFLAGTPISGALLGSENQWFRPIIFNGTVMLAGIPLLLVARFKQAKRKGKRYV